MANQKINFKKTIKSNQNVQNTEDPSFKEVALSEEQFDDSKIKSIYDDLFYTIPKEGDQSHESILIQSTDIKNPQINQNLDNDIRALESQILDKDEEYLKATLPDLENAHALFPNGIFLQEGNVNDNSPLDPESQIWFVQQGFKRAIKGSQNAFWTNLIRKSIGDKTKNPATGNPLPLAPPIIRYATPEEITSIKEGQDIISGTDLSIKTIEAKDEQTVIYSRIKLSLECQGVERWYEYQEGEDFSVHRWYFDHMNLPHYKRAGYFWLDKQAHCEITYLSDTDPSFTFTPQETTKIWKGDTWIGTYISRDASLYPHGDPLDTTFYTNPINIVEKSGHIPLHSHWEHRFIEEWGEGNKFPAIINASPGSRITYKMEYPSMGAGGAPLHPGTHLLNGIENKSGWDDRADPQWHVLDNPYKLYSEYGTRMIHRECFGPIPEEDGCYGALGQGTELQALFEDPTFNYYREYIDTPEYDTGHREWEHGPEAGQKITPIRNAKVYGQPILKVGGKNGGTYAYSVFMGGYRKNLTDWFIFYDLEYGDFWQIKNSHLHKSNKEHVHGYKHKSDRLFTWFRDAFRDDGYNQPTLSINGFELPDVSPHINNPTLFYPGLKGEQINHKWSDLDIWMGSEVMVGPGFNSKVKEWQYNNQDQLRDFNFNPSNNIATSAGFEKLGSNYWGLSSNLTKILDIRQDDFIPW